MKSFLQQFNEFTFYFILLCGSKMPVSYQTFRGGVGGGLAIFAMFSYSEIKMKCTRIECAI